MRILPILLATLIFLGCSTPTPKYEHIEHVVVDSVWVIPVSTTSTLQFDPIYKCSANDMKFTVNSSIRVGDTLTLKWIKY